MVPAPDITDIARGDDCCHVSSYMKSVETQISALGATGKAAASLIQMQRPATKPRILMAPLGTIRDPNPACAVTSSADVISHYAGDEQRVLWGQSDVYGHGIDNPRLALKMPVSRREIQNLILHDAPKAKTRKTKGLRRANAQPAAGYFKHK